MCPILMLVVRGPTYWCVMSFVGSSFVSLLLLFFLLRIVAALRTIGDPSHDVSLVRIGLRNQWEVIGVSHAL